MLRRVTFLRSWRSKPDGLIKIRDTSAPVCQQRQDPAEDTPEKQIYYEEKPAPFVAFEDEEQSRQHQQHCEADYSQGKGRTRAA